ncbi:hypothetical protein Pcinc_041675 [Petrolisthes cinctipes]|uniref:Uncharacterized protein n=1 Tax=Petrolisthes cinctipes TaxID=88211 RepID=A0AAE1BJ02_PETCI|nr:hypothetical protein Pcinc_041675 [Petrolisthes cinctipes]
MVKSCDGVSFDGGGDGVSLDDNVGGGSDGVTGMLVRRGEEEESEVERIQDLFPHDDLRLHERDPVTQSSGELVFGGRKSPYDLPCGFLL